MGMERRTVSPRHTRLFGFEQASFSDSKRELDQLFEQLRSHEGAPVLVVERRWEPTGRNRSSEYFPNEPRVSEDYCLGVVVPPFLTQPAGQELVVHTEGFAYERGSRLCVERGLIGPLLAGGLGRPLERSGLIPVIQHTSALEIVVGAQEITSWVYREMKRTWNRSVWAKSVDPTTLFRMARALGRPAALFAGEHRETFLRMVNEAKLRVVEEIFRLLRGKQMWKGELKESLLLAFQLGLHEEPWIINTPLRSLDGNKFEGVSLTIDVPKLVRHVCSIEGIPVPPTQSQMGI